MDEMKQTKNSRLRRIASGLLAALMLMTSAPVSYALEPVIGIQQMAPEQAEETTGEEIPEPEQDPDNGNRDRTGSPRSPWRSSRKPRRCRTAVKLSCPGRMSPSARNPL